MSAATKDRLATTYHSNGTVTFWSVYQQCWVRTADVSDRELAAMSSEERERVIRHLPRRDPEQAGWSYGSDRACESTINRGVSFSWHQEHRGKCVRCGQTAPKQS
jgi:hypothetical protein